MPVAAISLPARFRPLSHIADGGMASVWAAEDRTLGRTVAIKLLAERYLEDPGASRRFAREARTAAQLSSHSHIVTIYDVGEHDGRPFIVMEHMSGGTLADRLRAGRPSHDDALRWVEEAAAAVDFGHRAGVVHRDVKPANLLLDRRGRLAVGDFGIAQMAHDTTLTASGQVIGTAAYLSPEQSRGDTATAASDIYALAVVAQELVTGVRPPAGVAPPGAGAGLRRGLDPDPTRRWPTATALAEALREGLGAAQVPAAMPATATTRRVRATPAPTPADARERTPRLAPGPTARRRSHTRRAALLAVAGAVVVAGGAALALGDSGAGPPASSSSPTAPAASRSSTSPRPTATGSATGDPLPGSPGSSQSGVGDLNARGFRFINAGRPDDAIAPLQQAVLRCGDSHDPVCGYALFNLAHALRLSGRPSEAIPLLERRLSFNEQTDVVEAELAAARAAVGSGGGGATPKPKDHAKAKGKKKGKKD